MTTYITKAGDAFDSIAFEQLGSERLTPQLIDANPAHVKTFIFPAGVELVLPEIISTLEGDLLPWK